MGAPNRSRRRVRARRGYTAVEVMMSIIVLGIGAVGVMSMQKAAIQGSNDARMIDMGNAIAREWVERLRRDAMTWIPPTSLAPTPNWSTNTFLVSQIGASGSVGSYQYLTSPVAPSTGFSIAFDILGRDYALPVVAGSPPPIFCTQVRGDWIVQDQLLRATVRVYWLRQMLAAPSGGLTCTATDAPDTNPATTYHFVYATTALGPGQ
jgi:prepilin-type N-terminal cleavage/methylation domain-containing protein